MIELKLCEAKKRETIHSGIGNSINPCFYVIITLHHLTDLSHFNLPLCISLCNDLIGQQWLSSSRMLRQECL